MTIAEVAQAITDTAGFTGRLEFDASRPDGKPLKLMDSARLLALGWTLKIVLHDGLADAYRHFIESDRPRAVNI